MSCSRAFLRGGLSLLVSELPRVLVKKEIIGSEPRRLSLQARQGALTFEHLPGSLWGLHHPPEYSGEELCGPHTPAGIAVLSRPCLWVCLWFVSPQRRVNLFELQTRHVILGL